MRVQSVTYKGVVYKRYPDAKAWSDRAYYKAGKQRLHRVVWVEHNGAIPKGYHVHHRNHDRGDNRVENLELMRGSDHNRHHSSRPEHIARIMPHLAKARAAAAKWHGSPEGIAWHRDHAKKLRFGKRRASKRCAHCGDRFEGSDRKFNVYCSLNCRVAARRKRGTDDVQRTCLHCGSQFMVNRYWKNVFCSRRCASRHRAARSQRGV